jgi:hypothetical protein
MTIDPIFDGPDGIVNLADIQHIQRCVRQRSRDPKDGVEPNGIQIITSGTKWNMEVDVWENAMFIQEKNCQQYIDAWKQFCRDKLSLQIYGKEGQI